MLEQRGNLTSTERWISVVSGAGLTLAALTRGSFLSRGLTAITGLALVSRGASGYCGMKAALVGDTSIKDGLKKQWEQMRSGAPVATPARDIDSMETLYMAEVQELHSAESQLCSLLETLPETMPEMALQRALRGYATEIRTRREDLERIVRASGANPRQHPDQAMQALLHEARKMSQMRASNVRSAALIDSLQRILHYKIASYGSVAAYAQTLGRTEEGSRLAEYADRDKAIDQELTSIAKETVNPQAQAQPRAGEPDLGTARAH